MKILVIPNEQNESPCLSKDGKIRITLEEEKIMRIKRYKGFQENTINIIFSTITARSEDM